MDGRLTIGGLLAIGLLAGCGSGDSGGSNSAPSPAPTPFTLAGCSADKGGPLTGLEGIGGSVAQFAVDHPEDSQHPAEFGDAVGPELFTTACYPGTDIIGSIDYGFPPDSNGNTEGAEAIALEAIRTLHLVPPDATQVSVATPEPCKLITMHSSALAQDLQGVDASSKGDFIVELNRPVADPGNYDPNKVSDIIVSTDTAPGC
jgi:hypothetical protein